MPMHTPTISEPTKIHHPGAFGLSNNMRLGYRNAAVAQMTPAIALERLTQASWVSLTVLWIVESATPYIRAKTVKVSPSA
jgi:hypothetical protein